MFDVVSNAGKLVTLYRGTSVTLRCILRHLSSMNVRACGHTEIQYQRLMRPVYYYCVLSTSC